MTTPEMSCLRGLLAAHSQDLALAWAVPQHTDTSKTIRRSLINIIMCSVTHLVWAVSQHTDTSKTIRRSLINIIMCSVTHLVWAVSQHTDTSKTIRQSHINICAVLRTQLGLCSNTSTPARPQHQCHIKMSQHVDTNKTRTPKHY